MAGGSAISRRTIVKGAAWSVPVLMIANATPAFASSGPISLGRILESSQNITGLNIGQSSMYLEGNDSIGAGSIQNVKFTITVTINYDPAGDDSGFSLVGAVVQSVNGRITSQTPTQIVMTFADLGYTIGGSGQWSDAGTGFHTSYVLHFVNGGPVPKDGSITVTAHAHGIDPSSGQEYIADGLIMGRSENTTTPTDPPVYPQGPLFQYPGPGFTPSSAITPFAVAHVDAEGPYAPLDDLAVSDDPALLADAASVVGGPQLPE